MRAHNKCRSVLLCVIAASAAWVSASAFSFPGAQLESSRAAKYAAPTHTSMCHYNMGHCTRFSKGHHFWVEIRPSCDTCVAKKRIEALIAERSAKRSLQSSISAQMLKKILLEYRHKSESTLSFIGQRQWMLANRHSQCADLTGWSQRAVCRKARALYHEHTALIKYIDKQILEHAGPAWCHELKGNRLLGCNMAYQFWPSEAEWRALDELWQRESEWNPYANNPGSDACGIPQAMNNCAYGHDPVAQIGWGLNYIQDRPEYGTPSAALAFWKQKYWY